MTAVAPAGLDAAEPAGIPVPNAHGSVVVERYLRALSPWMSPAEPAPDDTVVAVRIGRDQRDGLAFRMVFSSGDFAGCTWRDTPAAVRLCAPRSVLRDVASGARSGSGTVMSNRVAVAGDRRVLGRLAALARRPRLGAYLADVGAVFGADAPAPGAVRVGARSAPAGGCGPSTGAPVVAVLGAPNDPSGSISRIAMDRCRAAVELCRTRHGRGLVLCGGFGAHFNTSQEPHWKHCARWLAGCPRALGQPILGCLESRHTYEDVLLLRELVESLGWPPVTVVTSDYHARRVRLILDVLLPDATVHPVAHPRLGRGEHERLGRHEARALALTAAATLLFGPDRRPSPSWTHDAGRVVLRPG